MRSAWVLPSFAVLACGLAGQEGKPGEGISEKVLSKRQLDFDGGGGGVNNYVNGDVEVVTYITGDVLADGEQLAGDEDYDHYDEDTLDAEKDFWRMVSIDIL